MSITGSEQWMYSSGREFYDFPIEQSLRFNDDDNAYLSRTPASAGNRKTWTFSCWVKRGKVSGTDAQILTAYTSASDTTNIIFQSGGAIQWYDYISGYRVHLVTNALYRDVGSWYHLLFQLDTSSASGDRAKIYVNGERVTSFSTEVYPSLNADLKMNTAIEHRIGDTAQFAREFDGYMAEVNFIDGQQLDPTSFGEFKSGIWIPKDTAGLTYGTNGYRLQFGDTTEASGFNAVTYTGNGSSQSVSGVGFSSSPDLVWTKKRSSTSAHYLVDSVRGSDKVLFGNLTDAEATSSNVIASLDSDGFSIGADGGINASGQTFVGWAWDAGSGSAASNTDGSITSTVKANTDYGFSIVSYTGNGTAGATVGHGLTVAPDMIIVKNRDTARVWPVYHGYNTPAPETEWLRLNDTNATADEIAIWNDTAPTSSVFTLGSSVGVNESGDNFISYCFHSVSGYSKFSSYTGTGATGNSITTGFKPAFIMFKRTDSTSDWFMLDNTRDTSNPIDKKLEANTSGTEVVNAAYETDFNSDGFVLQNTNAQLNASGGTYIYMAFADTRDAAFWRDTSGQGNDWQPNNLTFSDVVPDAPSNNFAVLNPLDSTGITSSWYIEEGNTAYTVTNNSAYRNCSSTFFPENLKGYFEWSVVVGTPNFSGIGMYPVTANPSSSMYNTTTTVYCLNNGNLNTGSTTSISSMLSSFSTGDVGMCAFDFTGGTRNIWFGKNGSWGIDGSGNTQDPANGNNPAHTFSSEQQLYFASNTGAGTQTIGVNFGQDSTFAGARAAGGNADENGYGDFQYAVPSGFLSLCSANLPSGAIDTLADETPEDYFNTALYTGNGGTQSITGVNFQPSLTWIKSRSAAYDHVLIDAVRGVEKQIISNKTDAESQDAGKGLTSFDSDGFTVTLGTSTSYNNSSQTYAAWNWKAGGAGVSNTDGSITSTVSVGATSQQNWFSIVDFTGAGAAGTVGHGLGVVPSFIVYKRRSSGGDNWVVYHDGISSSENGGIYLNLTNAWNSDSSLWNNTAPTSSVFSVGTYGGASGENRIAYCFANAEGLCKVGKYVGSAFVYTGFRPAFVLIKKASGGTFASGQSDWVLYDGVRNPSNPTDLELVPNSSQVEDTYGTGGEDIDMLSNGFKILTSSSQMTGTSTYEYIYLAIAEQPFAFANAR